MGLPVPQGLTFGRTSPWGCSPGSPRGWGGPWVSPLAPCAPGVTTRCAPVSPLGVHAALSPPLPSPRSAPPIPTMWGVQLLLPLHPQLLRAAEGGSWICTEEPLKWTGRALAARVEAAPAAGEGGIWGRGKGGMGIMFRSCHISCWCVLW